MQTVSYMFMEQKLSLGIYFITLFTLYAKKVALKQRISDRLIEDYDCIYDISHCDISPSDVFWEEMSHLISFTKKVGRNQN